MESAPTVTSLSFLTTMWTTYPLAFLQFLCFLFIVSDSSASFSSRFCGLHFAGGWETSLILAQYDISMLSCPTTEF